MPRSWASAPLLAAACLGLVSLCASCVAAPSGHPIALRDPYGLIDDVVATGNDIRLYVVPSETYACNGDGTVTPAIPDAPTGEFADAIVDITLMPDTATDTARGDARVPVGSWTILVRGKGTDPVTMIPNSPIATGCTTVDMLGAGETREVSITLQPVTGMGMCGDGILSPDEQCEGPGMGTCNAMCQSIAVPLNNATTAGVQSAPHVAGRAGHRVIGTFDSDSRDTVLRLLDPNGVNLTTPGALERDATVDSILGGMSLSGAQLGGAPAVAPDGRIAIPLVDFAMPSDTDVRLVLLDESRTVLTAGVHLRTARAMHQRRPSAAFAGSGALLIAFEDVASTTGISATFIAAGATMPSAEARPVAQTGATEPVLAGHDGGFVLAFTQGADVYFQRFGADGTATDATPRAVLETATGTQDQPTVAALSSGVFVVAFREGDVGGGDGNGTSIRARIFGADGVARGMPFVVNTTTLGDQAAPAVAGTDGRFLFAWENAGEIRARVFGENGMGLLNRERIPAATDFPVGMGTVTAPSVCAVGMGGDAGWLIAWAAPADGLGDVLFRRYAR